MSKEIRLFAYRGRVLAWQKEEDFIAFTIENCSLIFRLYKEECLLRYSKCLHWITQEYPNRLISMEAYTMQTCSIALVSTIIGQRV